MVLCVVCGGEVEPFSCSRSRCTACLSFKPRVWPKCWGMCPYCGAWGKLTKDHIVPKSRGGCSDPENIMWVCASCNTSKGSLLIDEWLMQLPPDAPQQLMLGSIYETY